MAVQVVVVVQMMVLLQLMVLWRVVVQVLVVASIVLKQAAGQKHDCGPRARRHAPQSRAVVQLTGGEQAEERAEDVVVGARELIKMQHMRACSDVCCQLPFSCL
jgi:hypothetical protein